MVSSRGAPAAKIRLAAAKKAAASARRNARSLVAAPSCLPYYYEAPRAVAETKKGASVELSHQIKDWFDALGQWWHPNRVADADNALFC